MEEQSPGMARRPEPAQGLFACLPYPSGSPDGGWPRKDCNLFCVDQGTALRTTSGCMQLGTMDQLLETKYILWRNATLVPSSSICLAYDQQKSQSLLGA